jgi:two-component system sensor histidine kinase UhpB
MPRWFVDLLSPTLAPKYVNVDEDHTIILIPEPRNEISEVWTQLQDDCVAVGLFCGLSLLLTSLVVRHGLRPLERLSSALSTLSSGDYSVRIQPRGPPELARLADGVNAMAEQLQAAQARNLRLEEQLLRLQEEERADIARDLHDEIGPFLFAVRLDAAAIEHATKAGGSDQVRERAQAIRHAVGHMQVHVRSMLQRLRPVNPADVGLAQALDNLVAFWRARRPTIDLVLHIPDIDDGLGAPTVAAAYRLVQESLSNAIRHGDPSRIEISVVLQEAGMLRIDVIDDGTGLTTPKKPGLGLTGMRERIEALNGTLEIGPGKHGRGLAVIVYLPCTTVSEDA